MFEKYNIIRNINLAKYTRFNSGGDAKFLFIPSNEEELIGFLKENNDKNINIIGAGSNLLIRDGLLDGIFILMKNLNEISIINNKIIAGSGALTSKLYNFSKNNCISGFEFLGCIPGTVGGACFMNAGCYGCEIKNILYEIKAVDFDGNINIFKNEDCLFEYRKNNLPDNLIFLNASFNINEKKDKKEIESIFNEMMNKKILTQPINEKTCGSTFKNIEGMSAWKIIQDLGLQDVNFNGVKFSEKHANFLVNFNNASSKDIENLINITKYKTKEKFALDLELEIKIIG